MEHKINTDHICPDSPIHAHWWIGTNARENGWELFQCKWCLEARWRPCEYETAYRVAVKLRLKRHQEKPKEVK